MAAPAAPIAPHTQLTGFKLTAGVAVPAMCVGWSRTAVVAGDVGVLRVYDGTWHEVATGADQADVVVWDTAWAGGTITNFDLLLRNGADDSASVVLTYSGRWTTVPPNAAAVSVANKLEVSEIAPTSVRLTWFPRVIRTNATHWVIRLTTGVTVTDIEVAWPIGMVAGVQSLTTVLTDLLPGTVYTVQVAGRYNGPSSTTYTSAFGAVVAFATQGGDLGIAGPSDVELLLNVPVPSAVWQCQAGPVTSWNLAVAAPGVTVTVRAGITGNTLVDLTGTPSLAGIFDMLLFARATPPGGVLTSVPKIVRCLVEGGLLLPWLHRDPTLYDLQLDLRGDATRRAVQSYYQTAATGAATVTSTKNLTIPASPSGTPETAVTAVSETVAPAVAGNLLTLKRGDAPRIAVVIKDGRRVLDDGVDVVKLGIRLPDSEDDEYLFTLTGTATYAASFGENRRYFLIEFEVTDEMLELVMSGDGATTVNAIGEILLTYNARAITSATFNVTFVEDLIREP